jgi:ankyrin repeat protein
MASTSDELFAAISQADIERVRVLLAEHPTLATARDELGVSVLMRARYRFDRGLVEAVKAHLDELDVFEAATFGDLDRLTALLDADPSSVAARGGDGFTPLHLAAFFGQTDAVALVLARGAEVDARGTGWMIGTPLHSAASARHRDAARFLLDAGADPNARQAGDFTPLHGAAHNGDAALVELLLSRGADPTRTTEDGKDAIGYAEESGDLATIEALAQATA